MSGSPSSASSGAVVVNASVDVSVQWSTSVTGFTTAAVSSVTTAPPPVLSLSLLGSGAMYTLRVTFLSPLRTGNVSLSVDGSAGTVVPASGPALYVLTLDYSE